MSNCRPALTSQGAGLSIFSLVERLFFLQAGVCSYTWLWMRVPFSLHKCHVTASILHKNFIHALHLQLSHFFICFTVIFSKCRKQTGSASKLKPKCNNSYDWPWKYSILHRLKIIGSPECACKQGIQTVDHLIFQCKRLKNEREMLKNNVLKAGNWLVSKCELINRNLKQFISYMNSMDLEKINHSKNRCKWTLITGM